MARKQREAGPVQARAEGSEPRFEGTILLRDGRSIGVAEYGPSEGRPICWFHGTPGGRRQVPLTARRLAAQRGVRIIALERPGVGSSTPKFYGSIRGWADDMKEVADQLDLRHFGLIGLSGGGPYVLACAHDLRERVVAGAILGGVAPSQGEEAAPGGAVGFVTRFELLVSSLRLPLGSAFSRLVRALVPLRNQMFDLYLRSASEGDREIMNRPEMREMFIDDLIRASRDQLQAPIDDLVYFTRPWGFSIRDIQVPIRLWHGDADPIVPLSHGKHLAQLIPDSQLSVRPGEGHLGNLDAIEAVLETILGLWPSGATRRLHKKGSAPPVIPPAPR